jgi:phosphate transport system permease protein
MEKAPATSPGAKPSPSLAARARAAWRRGDLLLNLVLTLCGLGVLALFGYVFWILGEQALPSLQAFGLRFLSGRTWAPSDGLFGALPFISGTLLTSLLGLLFALPIAVGTAVALVFLLPRWIARPLGLVIELLAAVPSIVFGVWGFNVILPFVRDLSGGQSLGPSILAAGLVLTAMVLPILTTVTREMLKAVPRDQADAALALGSTPWEVTWKVVLPYARGGITAAAILGLGRAFGETMAVIMVVGNNPVVTWNLFEPGSTMASIIANQFGEAADLHKAALLELGLLLLVISLLLNLLAKALVRRLGVRT